jgi:hypothetical protein
VIPILGAESAYRAEGQNNRDYIEIDSFEALIAALEKLKNNPALRTSLREQGKLRYEKVSAGQLVKKWESFLIKEALPAYEKWCKSSFKRRMFLITRIPNAVLQKIMLIFEKVYRIIAGKNQ